MSQVIYDGNCPICIGLKEFSEQNTSKDKLEFIPYQSSNLPPGVTRTQASQALYVVTEQGEQQRGARAVFAVMRQMDGIWGLFGKLLSLPPFYWLAEPFYRLFARHRHRIPQ